MRMEEAKKLLSVTRAFNLSSQISPFSDRARASAQKLSTCLLLLYLILYDLISSELFFFHLLAPSTEAVTSVVIVFLFIFNSGGGVKNIGCRCFE